MDKAEGAFLTIGELARELGVAQHILRYWESRFSQLKPLQRSGNRRYYRPADVVVARRINQLLNEEGFTVRGAQRVLDGHGDAEFESDSGSAGTAETTPAVRPSAAHPELPKTFDAGPALAAPSLKQAELSFGSERDGIHSRGQIDSSDIALLIARLTVIRENLKDAIGAS